MRDLFYNTLIRRLRMEYLLLIALVLCFALACLGLMGCAKTTGPDGEPIPPTPAEVAVMISDGMEGLSHLSLVVIHSKAPEIYSKVEHQIMFTIAQLKIIQAEGVTVGSVSDVLANLFNNLNQEFMLVKSDDAVLVLTTVTIVAGMVQGYFIKVELPEDIALYNAALIQGLENGLHKAQGSIPAGPFELQLNSGLLGPPMEPIL